MIAGWMLHSVLVAALVALAARIAEGALAAYRLPVRWAWAGAAAGAAALPAAAAADLPARLASLLPLPVAAHGGAASALPGGAGPGPPPAPPQELALPALPEAGPLLLAAWIAGSLLLASAWARAWIRLRRRRRGWRKASVEGVEVLLSEEEGPAVIGLADPAVVLPRWAMELPREERRLVLRHELEHRNARDPVLLALGLAVLVAVPWNPAVWWIIRRLRLAVELDCDRRVLAAGAAPGVYGALLLNVTRDRRAGAVPAAALVERPSQLERRIRAMTDAIPKFRGLRTALLAALGAGLLAAACDAPTPVEAPEAAGDEAAASRGVDDDLAVGPEDVQEPDSLRRRRLEADSLRVRRMEAVRRVDADSLRRWRLEADSLRLRRMQAVRRVEADSVRIRGNAALDLDADGPAPLILLDGERLEEGSARLSALRPDAIEAIEVLKGRDAVAAYGEAARDGVIRITTENGPGSG